MDWRTFETNIQNSREMMPQLREKPTILVVLGSGLFEVVKDWEEVQRIGFEEIPHHPRSGVMGHPGWYEIRLVGKIPVVFSLGRVHLYEGYTPREVVYGLTLWAKLGVKGVVLTNAAGGIGEYEVGSVVALTDHINHQGTSPLVGCPSPQRFVPMVGAYDKSTWEYLSRQGFPTGVYAGVLGPQYESPAEIKALSFMGATVVGMSMVQEAIMARYLGLRLCGLSVVTNRAAGLGEHTPEHHHVLQTAKNAAKRIRDALEMVIHLWEEK
ncbi:MAG: purine-nucleoside phosphorylase [Brevinematales bacterium]|nr:purine-nucleoside phosphorylase [Brevinematales bacterium]